MQPTNNNIVVAIRKTNINIIHIIYIYDKFRKS